MIKEDTRKGKGGPARDEKNAKISGRAERCLSETGIESRQHLFSFAFCPACLVSAFLAGGDRQ
jgi:hypothetical protein